MRTVAIIQARMGSTRLPGKVLMDIGGQPTLSRVVRRLARARRVSQIVVATTISPLDDILVEETFRIGVECFRGSEQDVLARYCEAASAFQADAIVRITSDCPLIDPTVVDDVITVFLEKRPDVACNDLLRTFPRGLDTEVFTSQALQRADQLANLPHQREHVTPIFYERQDIFSIHAIRAEQDYSRYRWTLDTPEDLQLIRTIYSHFENRDDFTWHEVLRMLEDSPELGSLNSHVLQKRIPEATALH